MRRLLGITLVLLFSLPLVAPLFALSADGDMYVPACCRHKGAHHCTEVRIAVPAGPGASLTPTPQHCPAYPAVITPLRHSDLGLHSASLFFAELLRHPAVKPQTLARVRIALDRARQKRGPPTQLL